MIAFRNLYRHGFVRAAAISPPVALADPALNGERIIAACRAAAAIDCAFIVFPELSVTGYSIDDLILQRALLDAAETAIARIAAETAGLAPLIAIGAPVRGPAGLYNCAIILHRGVVLGVVPKTFLPNYREYYEKRHFASGAALAGAPASIAIAGQSAPFAPGLVFGASDLPDFAVSFEICEDLWAPIPPSTHAAFDGALLIGNLSASPVAIGKAHFREQLIGAQAERSQCGYLYAAAGYGESTNDLAWDGQLSAFELGRRIGRSARFQRDGVALYVDFDVERIRQERWRNGTFRDGANLAGHASRAPIPFRFGPDLNREIPLRRTIERFPFAPSDAAALDSDCYEAYSIQVHGLMRRLEAARAKKAVIGVSGGLDSTQALLVAVRAMRELGRPAEDVIGVSMPGFATGSASRANAQRLMAALGVSARETDIRPLAAQMFRDLDHPFARGEPYYDIVFENVQAGLRTDYLFRLANQEQGLVVGTGDLSELALGWCTYGVGDQMSHYNVNASLAKTLIQHLVRWNARREEWSSATRDTLEAILAAPISPELKPAGAGDEMQRTEDEIGPYALQDFTLFYATRYGFAPAKIAFLADHAWGDRDSGEWPVYYPEDAKRAYDLATIIAWLRVFAARFYGQSQFKRSAAPNGPKISSGGSLSPRGDWRAPSDAQATLWLAAVEALAAELGLTPKP